MSKISTYNIAMAIYQSSVDKTDARFVEINNNTIALLDKMHLLSKSDDILDKLQDIIDKKESRIRAIVTTQKEIAEKEKSEIEIYIKKRQNAEHISVDYKIDTNVIGGIKIEIGDEIIDTTIAHQLEKLKIHLNK